MFDIERGGHFRDAVDAQRSDVEKGKDSCFCAGDDVIDQAADIRDAARSGVDHGRDARMDASHVGVLHHVLDIRRRATESARDMGMEIDNARSYDQATRINRARRDKVVGHIFNGDDLVAFDRDVALIECRGVGVEKRPTIYTQITLNRFGHLYPLRTARLAESLSGYGTSVARSGRVGPIKTNRFADARARRSRCLRGMQEERPVPRIDRRQGSAADLRRSRDRR